MSARCARPPSRLADTIGANPYTLLINFDWNEPAKVVRVDVDQDKARQLGISSSPIDEALNATVSGTAFTQVRDGDLPDRRGGPGHQRGAQLHSKPCATFRLPSRTAAPCR